MKRIALVTDSTSDLTEKIKAECETHVIPLKVRFGEQEFYDGEISSEEFYRRLETTEELPKTSQPSPEEFIQLYSRLLEEYHEIISIHISSGLSGTFNAARIAGEKLKGKIHLVDSKTISLGAGVMILETANLIREGLDSVHIVDKLTRIRTNVETLFTLNTLEYLQKGGRIGRVQSIMGSFLNIKPIVRVGDDGIYQSLGKARSQEKALKNIVEAFQVLAKGRKNIRFGVAHGGAFQAGSYLKEAMENAFQMPAAIFTQVGPVIGVHTGPGTIGAAFQFES
ncbi:MAG: DegV family protein [Peptococcaceae bacterium]|nr:DegV family protein [Peptococcaceae bacterium]